MFPAQWATKVRTTVTTFIINIYFQLTHSLNNKIANFEYKIKS